MDHYTFHREHVLAGDGQTMAELAGGRWQAPEIILPYGNGELKINCENGDIFPELGNRLQAAIVYQYIAEAVGVEGPGSEYISFLQLPNGDHHNVPFHIEAEVPLSKRFGSDLVAFAKAARALGGIAVEGGDQAYQFRYFPKVYLRIIIWEADDEFPAKAVLLFDNKSQFHLDTAGLYSLGINFAKRLIAEADK